MFEIDYNSDGEIALSGRLDASSADQASAFMNDVRKPVVVSFEKLEYISSAGLGVLLATQQRLLDQGEKGLKLVRLNKHIGDVFRIAGFGKVFEIEFAD